MRICTVGHGARPVETLLATLTEAGVRTLVDVRRFPGSRRHPRFGRDALEAAVVKAGLDYTWQGDTLGGRRESHPGSRHTALRNASLAAFADHMDTTQFRTAADQLLTTAQTEPQAILCAETLWYHCHRMLIADALLLRGATVDHLLEPGTHQPHRLTAGARPDDDGWPVYDTQPTLPGL